MGHVHRSWRRAAAGLAAGFATLMVTSPLLAQTNAGGTNAGAPVRDPIPPWRQLVAEIASLNFLEIEPWRIGVALGGGGARFRAGRPGFKLLCLIGERPRFFRSRS